MVKWFGLALLASPIWLGLGLAIWENWIRPRTIPQWEIERLAGELIAQGGNPEVTCLINEDRARCYGDGLEEGRWRRVRKEIRRRSHAALSA